MAAKISYPIEVRSPRSTLWIITIVWGLFALGAVTLAALDLRLIEGHEAWTSVAAVALTALWIYLTVQSWSAVTRLYADRVERANFFRTQSIRRADIVGYRVQPNATIRLVSREGRRGDLVVTQEIGFSEAWMNWLGTLSDLDNQGREDARLGHTPKERERTLEQLNRASSLSFVVGAGVAAWLWFWPTPYLLAVVACAIAPWVALVWIWRWRGLVGFEGPEKRLGGDMTYLFIGPPLVISLRAMTDYHLLDVGPSLLVATALALLFAGLILFVESAARHWLIGTFFFAIAIAYVWGLLVIANGALDRSAPKLARGVVTAAYGPADDDPTLTISAPLLGRPVESIDVSAARFAVSPVGAAVCLETRAGLFGWRHAYVTDCPAKPVTE
ncbi:MAG: hypothetical protein K9G59_03110 [Caulobacter sp.]|nr:hypothetical protein [Caulobacter sp.]